MFKHEIKSVLRRLKHDRMVSSINILGLTVGFTFVILAGRYIYTEMTSDRFHRNYRSIYRVESETADHGHTNASPNILVSWLKDNIPEVKLATRILNDGGSGMLRNVVFNNIKYNIGRPLVIDADFFSIFSFQILQGETDSFQDDRSSLVLNESLAQKVFGSVNPVGQTIGYKNELYAVKAVIKTPPSNSSLKFDILLPIANLPDYANDTHWTNRTLQVFILAADGVSPTALQDKIQNGVISALKPLGYFDHVDPWRYKLNPMSEIYYSGDASDFICIGGNRNLTFLLFSIAVIVLLIAMINYVNASMVRASERTREIAVRSISGASVLDNVRLLIHESSLKCLIALALALIFSSWLEPLINPLLNVPLVGVTAIHIFMIIIGGLILGVLSSTWPALRLSRVGVADSLKGKKAQGKGSLLFIGILSVVQFAASIVLIISLFVIYKQMDYTMRLSGTGIDENLVLYMPLSHRTPIKSQKIYTIQTALKSLPEVDEASTSLHLPGDERYSGLGVNLRFRGEEGEEIQVNHNMVDGGYPEVMGYEIVAGRSFNPAIQSDYGAYLVNETFMKTYRIEDLSEVELNGSPIIGVIKDIHFNSLRKTIAPMALRYDPSYQSRMVVRLASANVGSLSSVINKMKQTIDAIDSTAIADINFLDRHIAALYDQETRISKIIFLMALFSILISCMGLFSMSLFAAKSRTKEIGIRKVIGAKVGDLMVMLSRDYMKWVAVAFMLACPLAWYFMNKWLAHFAYRTTLDWWIFALTGAIALGIALMTVSWQTWRAASRDPVEALRYE